MLLFILRSETYYRVATILFALTTVKKLFLSFLNNLIFITGQTTRARKWEGKVFTDHEKHCRHQPGTFSAPLNGL